MTITTKWHDVYETVGRGDVCIYTGDEIDFATGKDWFDPKLFAEDIKQTIHCPKIVIDPELSKLITGELAARSVEAMYDANVLRLPYPELCIELDMSDDPYDTGERYLFHVFEVFDYVKASNGTEYADFVIKPLSYIDKGNLSLVRTRSAYYTFTFVKTEGAFKGEMKGFVAPYIRPSCPITDEGRRKEGEADHFAVGRALLVALTITNTRGIEKEVIEPVRLNKHRIRKGKAPVPKHTILRLGHAYDRSGKKVDKKDLGVSKVDGRKMVYWRKGHTRNQKYGPQWSKERLIYIEPVLVNFSDGDEEAVTKAPTIVAKW